MPAGHRCGLEVAGVGITLKTAHPLPVTERFRPFLAAPAPQGWLAEYREVPAFPAPEGKPLWRSESYEVYACPGGYQRRWYDGTRDDLCFAVSRGDWSRRRVLVEYLRGEEKLISTLGNCYSFSCWETMLLWDGRLILHASCVETPLGGLLFSGPSGIGKSTQAELWVRHMGAKLINGDRPVLYEAPEGWLACGSPYAGSSHCYLHESCSVRAVVMLRQAKQCALRRLSGAEAFRAVFRGLTASVWDPACMERACALAESLTARVPVYELACTPDRDAVDALRRELEKE